MLASFGHKRSTSGLLRQKEIGCQLSLETQSCAAKEAGSFQGALKTKEVASYHLVVPVEVNTSGEGDCRTTPSPRESSREEG